MLFAFGLASLITWLRERPMVGVTAIASALVVGNVFFMMDVKAGRLPSAEGITLDRILGATYRRLGNPFSFPANAVVAWRNKSDAVLYDRVGEQRFNNARIDIGELGDDRFLGGGWSTRERNSELSYRWTVGRESYLVIALRGPRYVEPGQPQQLADYLLQFSTLPFQFDGAPPQSIEVYVNRQLVTTQALQPELTQYEVVVPHQYLRRTLNQIRFRYSYTASPREVGLSDDPRQLAVLFDYVNLVQQR